MFARRVEHTNAMQASIFFATRISSWELRCAGRLYQDEDRVAPPARRQVKIANDCLRSRGYLLPEGAAKNRLLADVSTGLLSEQYWRAAGW